MWESVLSEDLLRAKKKKRAKPFAERCRRVLTLFRVKVLEEGIFPVRSPSPDFAFSALKSVSNESSSR